MQFVKQEQNKLREDERKNEAKQRRRLKKNGKPNPIPHDSASDITDLEEEGILNKYYEEKMTHGQKK